MKRGKLNNVPEAYQKSRQLTRCLQQLEKGEVDSQSTALTNDTRQKSTLASRLVIQKHKKRAWECRKMHPELFTDKEAQKEHIQKILKSFSNLQMIQKILYPRPVHLVLDGGMSRALTPLSKAVSRKLGQHVYRCGDKKCIESMHILCFNQGAWDYITKGALENAQSFAAWKRKHRQFVIIEVPDLSDAEVKQSPKLAEAHLNTEDDLESSESSEQVEDSGDSDEDDEDDEDSESDSFSESELISPPSPSAFRAKESEMVKASRPPRRIPAKRSTEYHKISSEDFKRQFAGRLGLRLVDREGHPTMHPVYKDDKIGFPRKYQGVENATSCEDFDTDEETVKQNVIKTLSNVSLVLSQRNN